MKDLSIYIHIPFCNKKKCSYCSFVSFCNQDEKMEDYIKALCKEIEIRGKQLKYKYQITTVFIGGGTPSVLHEGQVVTIMQALKKNFKFIQNTEITIESNPDTISENKLREYKLAGVNRLSFGAQTLNDNILQVIGRRHNSKQVKEAIKLAKKVGFKNINVDMMLGLPNQKMKDVKNMTYYLVKSHIQHISSYSLILEEGTPLYNYVNKGIVQLPTEEETVNMYDKVYEILKKHHYNRYEVSNFALDDFECVHNMNYWEQGEYLAFGVAGHSYLNGNRFSNTEVLKDYLEKLTNNELAEAHSEKLSLKEKREEAIMLGLRTCKGINLAEFDERFGGNLLKDKKREIEFLTNHGFISIKGGVLKIQEQAYYVLNSIISKLI